MKNELFNTSIRFNDFVKRNIVYISEIKEAFSSLMDLDDDVEVVDQASSRARTHIAQHENSNNFYYTAAIEYPFKTEPFMQTRYSDGSYPIWYGCLTIETTIYETVYHTIKYIKAVDGYELEDTIKRKRSIFDVNCSAILINLQGKEQEFPELVGDDYAFTHKLGRDVKTSGVSGIMSPSARKHDGVNVNIFKQDALSYPVLIGEIFYFIYPKEKRVAVKGLNIDLQIEF